MQTIKIKQITYATCAEDSALYGLSEDGFVYVWQRKKIDIYGWEMLEDKINL